MKRKTGMTLLMILMSLMLSAFPVYAGEWQQDEDDNWQYIQEDGSCATGWIEVDDEQYYCDENGNRKSDYWLKEDGEWYYFDEDGVLATNTWVDNYFVDDEGKMIKKRRDKRSEKRIRRNTESQTDNEDVKDTARRD